MTIGILCEKPSAARAMARALLDDDKKKTGLYKGDHIVIVNARGHLYELAQPEDQVPKAKAADYKKWELASLPWNHKDMAFKQEPIKGSAKEIAELKKALASVDEIAVATDIDPSGEGDAIAYNALVELSLDKKKLSRMEFTDESATSFQKAFEKRRAVKSPQDEGVYRKAQFRNYFDFMTIQHTRVATISAAQKAVLRQGRLKSAIVFLVGEQLKAYNDYVKKPFFQNRFKDENGVMYINPNEARFDTAAEVPKQYSASSVVPDSKQNKYVKPPRLLDLATLSARLSSKSYKAADVLATYQKMYDKEYLSYPRTEDRHITGEQFKEMLPLVDGIAKVVSVDTSILTERAPRKTHVKDSGAHGANRPGKKVPASLKAIETEFGSLGAMIYEELARSFLAMFAKDYAYEAQEGHVAEYPKFIGKAQVPKVMGWKDVFDTGDTKDEDDEENAAGLGTKAKPIVHEGANKRPEHPTMKWLMKQLETREVGTGATRTSTYADVTSTKARFPLLIEKRGKITMSEFGDMSYRILPGTKIGDLTATEQVFEIMDRIAAGTTTVEAELGMVADWVAHDITVMEKNAVAMRKELGLKVEAQQKERAEGFWGPKDEKVAFAREWSGHRFTDAEVTTLLEGKEIEFTATSAKTGNEFTARGKLEPQTYNGNSYVGFKADFGNKKNAKGEEVPPPMWCKHPFSDAELAKLTAGEGVTAKDFVSKKGNKFEATIHWKVEKGQKKLVPSFGS